MSCPFHFQKISKKKALHFLLHNNDKYHSNYVTSLLKIYSRENKIFYLLFL